MSTEQNTPYSEEFFEYQMAGALSSAKKIIPYVHQLINPYSVVDIGCGTGAFLSVFKELGVKEIFGIDGEYVNKEQLLIDSSEFMPFDLNLPLDLDKTYDLCISLEVAEHLPNDTSNNFIRSLVSLAPVILFSAAIPHQGGTHHVNEQWPQYWQQKFNSLGYIAIDCLRAKFWTEKTVEWWYTQNMLLYVKKAELGSYPKLNELNSKISATENVLSLIHPENYMQKVNHINYLENEQNK